MQLTREFYIPKEAILHLDDKENGVQIYRYTRDDKIFGLGFIGKSAKPYYNYRFRNEEERARRENLTIADAAAAIKRRNDRKAERMAFVHTLQIGDILHSSWGYEQTNNDFFEVVSVLGKSVVIREISMSHDTEGLSHWLTSNVTPRPGHYIGEPMTKKVCEGNVIKLNSYAWATKCDPKRSYYDSKYA